ncbi:daunorubicin resistance protein DrrA family ABC transporter ATP-binding protein [Okibacterium endophyticum]
MTTAIELREVRKRFGKNQVLEGITLRIESGTIFALLGPNGAGKTTIVNILSTLVKPDSGSVTVAGLDVVREPGKVKQAISLTGQSAAVDESLTGEENLRMMSRLSGLTRAEAKRRTADLLQQFDLTGAARKQAKTYSGGMRRRLDLAITLITTPPIVFLDEPTTGLDTRSRQELWDVIGGLRRSGTTILLTTQYLEEADQLADDIALINGGRVVAQGTPAALKAQVGGDVVELRDETETIVQEIGTDGTVHGLRTALDTLDRAAATGTVSLRRPSLDDVFLTLTDPAAPTGIPSSDPRERSRDDQKEFAS